MKTAELTGAALDWAVAVANNMKPILHKIQYGEPSKPFAYRSYVAIPMSNGDCWTYEPTKRWELAGQIIEREELSVECVNSERWLCGFYSGQTPLIAAMRCYVANKLGDDVDVPEEFL